MTDREKVITALETCASNIDCKEICPYYYPIGRPCVETMCKDVLELLKEQEPVKPVVNLDEWVCGCCGGRVEQQRMIHPGAILHDLCDYCPRCGKKVDWKEVKQDD